MLRFDSSRDMILRFDPSRDKTLGEANVFAESGEWVGESVVLEVAVRLLFILSSVSSIVFLLFF